MRGDVVYWVWGRHGSRAADTQLGARRTRAEAEALVEEFMRKEMHGRSWAAAYHDRGFLIEEVEVKADFVVPPGPTPRARYVVECAVHTGAEAWPTSEMTVWRRAQGGDDPSAPLARYQRNYTPWDTFEPFRQGGRDYALISRTYTRSAVLDLTSGEVIAEEADDGFCPVGFYVPDWWDVHDGTLFPGHPAWSADDEWPNGEFGFVWGCVWGDDSSWKLQVLDLRRITDGVLTRDERFGYVELATHDHRTPCFARAPADPGRRPPFIEVERSDGAMTVTLSVEMQFDLDTGAPRDWTRKRDRFE